MVMIGVDLRWVVDMVLGQNDKWHNEQAVDKHCILTTYFMFLAPDFCKISQNRAQTVSCNLYGKIGPWKMLGGIYEGVVLRKILLMIRFYCTWKKLT